MKQQLNRRAIGDDPFGPVIAFSVETIQNATDVLIAERGPVRLSVTIDNERMNEL